MSRAKRTAEEIEEARSIGRALYLLRQSRGLTPVELSTAAGVTAATIHRYERGCCNSPRHKTIKSLMDALGLPVPLLYQTQQLVDEVVMGTSPADGRPQICRQDALRLAQEVGKAVAHCCLAFMELQAGGWEGKRHGE